MYVCMYVCIEQVLPLMNVYLYLNFLSFTGQVFDYALFFLLAPTLFNFFFKSLVIISRNT